MRTHGLRNTVVVFAAATILATPSASRGQAPGRVAVATTPHFAFYSDFAANLQDALIVAGRARRAREPEIFQSGPEKACFDELPAAERAAWARAVDYYAEIVSPARYTDPPQFLPRLVIAGVATREELTDDGERRLVDILSGFRNAAAPAYERCHWPSQDAGNRRWIEKVVALLAVHEKAIGQRLSQLYGTPWAGLPFTIDVVETVDRTGANAVNLIPPGVHIVASSTSPGNQDRAALEVVFHEASHFLTGRSKPLPAALASAMKTSGNTIRGELSHPVLFYMTGEVVRRILEQAGEPPYTPYLYAQSLFSDRFRETIKSTWPAYMDGKRTLNEAAADLVRALSQPDDRRR